MMALPTMVFRRFGRSFHLRIESVEDLQKIHRLDEALWVATGAPVSTMVADPVFLSLLDRDGNGRIMVEDVKVAVCWLLDRLRDPQGVVSGSKTLRLPDLNTDDEEGRRIADSARKILGRLGEANGEDAEIALDQVRQVKAAVEAQPVSEAGVVVPEAAEATDVRQFLADIVGTVGGAPHPSGAGGVDKAHLEAFLAQARALIDWRKRGEIPRDQDKTEVMPLGDRTAEAFALVDRLRRKMDEYFAQCEAVAFDDRLAARVSADDEKLDAVDLADPASIDEYICAAPLARPRADRLLSLTDPINPCYADDLARLYTQVLEPVLGKSGPAVSSSDWQKVKQTFAAHEAWARSKAGAAVEKLDSGTLTQYLDDRYRQAVEALIAESARTAFVLDNIRLTEKLLLYQAHLLTLTNNFVSFPHVYDPSSRAMFDLGTLVMDGRRFNLAVKVENRAQHSEVAKTSNMYVLYVGISAKPGQRQPVPGQEFEVAVAVTSGGKGNLCVGKRGVFYDIHGTECDAKVLGVIENPISFLEAVKSPFIRLGRVLTGKIESMTTEAEKKLDTQAASAVTSVTQEQPGQQAPAPAARTTSGATGGMFLGAGVAVAALGSAVAYITKTLAQTHPVAILVGVLSAVLVVILPVSIVAILKLRRRDLSAILEGAGWAVNARMRLTRAQGRYFTLRPPYPKGSKGVRWIFWRRVIIAALIVVLLSVGGELLRRHLEARNAAATQPAGTPAESPVEAP